MAQAREYSTLILVAESAMSKATAAEKALKLTDIPNIGPSIAADLRSIGIETPSDVATMDPWNTYNALCDSTGRRHDPCVLDVFLAAHDFMNGGAVKPWWYFTAQRKARQVGSTD